MFWHTAGASVCEANTGRGRFEVAAKAPPARFLDAACLCMNDVTVEQASDLL